MNVLSFNTRGKITPTITCKKHTWQDHNVYNEREEETRRMAGWLKRGRDKKNSLTIVHKFSIGLWNQSSS